MENEKKLTIEEQVKDMIFERMRIDYVTKEEVDDEDAYENGRRQSGVCSSI